MKKQEVNFAKWASHDYLRMLSFLSKLPVFVLLLCGAAAAPLMLAAVPGVQAQPRGNAAVEGAETLQGHAAISLEVTSDSDLLPAPAVLALLNEAIKDTGIEVLPAGSFPVLRLDVRNQMQLKYHVMRGGSRERTDTFEIYTLELEFDQLLALPGTGSRQSVRGTTWKQSRYGYSHAGRAAHDLTVGAADMIAAFVRDYRRVNPAGAKLTSGRGDSPGGANSAAGQVAEGAVPVEAEVRPFSIRAHLYSSQTQNPTYRVQIATFAESGQQIITCTYGPLRPDGTGFTRYQFWYEKAPEGIAEMIPREPQHVQHPLWGMGYAAVSQCPESPDAAAARRILVRRR